MMKRLLLYIVIALAAIGCTKDPDVATQSGDNALTITSNIATRAEKSQWEKKDPIGVYMSSETLGDEGENVEYTTENGDGTFTSDDPLYIPSSGTVQIFAYYPYCDFDNREDATFAAYPIDSEDQIDLLSAENKSITSATSPVEMTFNHLLSKVSLSIEAGGGLSTAELADLEVEISGISTTATFNLNSNEATTTNSSDQLELKTTITTGDLDVITDISSSAIVIPQSLSGATLLFTTKTLGTFSATLPTEKFEVGKEYIYNITIQMLGIEITSSNIEEWGDGGSVPGIANIVDIEYKSDGKYYINSAKGLAAFRDLVNGASNTLGAIYAGFESDNVNGDSETGVAFGTRYQYIDGVLTRDIDISDVCGSSWTPIGIWVDGVGNCHYFGTFDGDGHEISGLYVESSGNLQTLFRYVGEGGEVCNLGVSGSITNNSGSTTYVTGGIVGWNYGDIFNCYSLVDIETNINSAGGIVGRNYYSGNVVNCHNHGSVSGSTNVGGIVGYNDDGYVGYCYSTGDLSNDATRVGGVVGYNEVPHDDLVYADPRVKGSFCLNTTTYSIGQISDKDVGGGLTGNVCTAEYLMSETFATTMTNGAATYNDGYSPAIKACAWVYNVGGHPTHDFGVEKDYAYLDISYNSISYNIYTAAGLQAFAALVNGDSKPTGVRASGDDVFFRFGTTYSDIDGKLLLTGDATEINLANITDITEWTPIGGENTPYSGTFDGNGIEVKNISINNSLSYQGVFGYTDGATIKNIGVTGSITAGSYVGGVVGYIDGSTTVINCYNRATVTAVADNAYIGGVVGTIASSNSAVVNSYNAGTVSATGAMSSNFGIGGVVGSNAGTVLICYNSAQISAESATTNLGNVIGDNSLYKVGKHCYTLEGTTTNDYIFGNTTGTWTAFIMTTTQMQSLSSTLNTAAASDDASSYDAICGWDNTGSNGYPAHVYGSTPTSAGGYTTD